MEQDYKATMNISDNDIATQLTENPEIGFRLLMKRYKEPIYWHIRRIVIAHSDAQDVAQETFLHVFRSFKELRNKDSLTAWIYRIATNEAIRWIKLKSPEMTSIDGNTDDILSLYADEYTDYTDLESVKLQKAINTLPPRQRIAFNLRYYDDLDYNEIAMAMDSTPANAKMNYHIAKNKIIDYMNSND